MRALIAGARGQIGQRCARFLERTAEVVELDLHDAPLTCDLRLPVPSEVREALAGCNVAIHLAGSRDEVLFDAAAAWRLFEANVIGTAHLLEALPRIDHVVVVSSISVYAAPTSALLQEDDLIAARTTYGASKIAAERVARMWQRRAGVPVTLVRLAQVYGPGTDPRNGIYRMIATARTGAPIRVDCRPGLLRDYVHVEDAGRLLAEIAQRPGHPIVNVGSGAGTRMDDLARDIARLWGAPEPILAGDEHVGGVDLVLDTARLRGMGLAPCISLAEGLAGEVARLRGEAA